MSCFGFSQSVENDGFHKLANVQAVVPSCVPVLAGRAAAAASVRVDSGARASPGERAPCAGETPAEQNPSSGATVHPH